jgi:hypothetical protein
MMTREKITELSAVCDQAIDAALDLCRSSQMGAHGVSQIRELLEIAERADRLAEIGEQRLLDRRDR